MNKNKPTFTSYSATYFSLVSSKDDVLIGITRFVQFLERAPQLQCRENWSRRWYGSGPIGSGGDEEEGTN